MNEFEYRVFIDETPYSIHFDTHSEDYRSIVVNNKQVYYEDKNDPDFRKSEIYVPIRIKNTVVILYVDEAGTEEDPIRHVYKIFVNGVSPIDGEKITDSKIAAKECIKKGFWGFMANKKIILKNLAITCPMGFLVVFDSFKNIRNDLIHYLILFIVTVLLSTFFAMVLDYFTNVSIVKKYKSKFKDIVDYDSF